MDGAAVVSSGMRMAGEESTLAIIVGRAPNREVAADPLAATG